MLTDAQEIKIKGNKKKIFLKIEGREKEIIKRV